MTALKRWTGSTWETVDPGASSTPLVMQAYISVVGSGVPHPSSGGTYIDLYEGNRNYLDLECALRLLPAGGAIQIHLAPPHFSAGTLHLNYAEMFVMSSDGTQSITVGLDAGLDVTTAGGPPSIITWDDDAEATKIGSDLSMVNDTVVSAAGGVFSVGVYMQFVATGLVA